MSDDLKPGDIVMLKSGGPDMTVADDGGSAGYLNCMWFDATGPQEQEFPVVGLKAVETTD